MSQTVIRFHPAAPQRPTFAMRARQAWLGLRQSIAAAHTRRLLAALDDRALSDIGISRAQAQFEAERPVWELDPLHHR